MGMVFLVGGLITLYLWVACFREPPGFNLTLLFLWIAFVPLAISLFTELATITIFGGIAAIISSLNAATASFTDLHRQAGLGEVLIVDELARKAREKLAEKIRPSEAPRPPEES
jgi:succinate-acetate transporter protein